MKIDPPEDDHVDAARAQWRAVRPDLDTWPIGIVARLGRVAAYLDQSIDGLMAEYGLTRASWDVLASLRRGGPPYQLTPTQLYRGLMRTSGAMTNRINRLEAAGLIERLPDAADGRRSLVQLTDAGRELVDRIAQPHLDNERRLLAGLDSDELVQFEATLRRLLAGLERTQVTPPRSGER